MDFNGVTVDTANRVNEAIDDILRSGISPVQKRQRIAKVLRDVGLHYHNQLYGATSYVLGAEVITSTGMATGSREARLAEKMVRNYALGRVSAPLVKEYYDAVLGMAQKEAFDNANSLQQHPTLTRSIVSETCDWCIEKAGTYTNPAGDDFARHDNCDCLLAVSGYRTRNGELKNYRKGSDNA